MMIRELLIFSLLGSSLYAQQSTCSSIVPVAPCGTQIAIWPLSGGQPALSNGPTYQGGPSYQGTGTSCAGGARYQCVNYVNQYYKNVMKVDTSQWYANAVDYYANAKGWGLEEFPNGSATPPSANDILVFQDGINQPGHVAIIESVSPSSITVIEQNYCASGQAIIPLQFANGGYTIASRGNCTDPTSPSCFTPVGWLRPPGSISPNPIPAVSLLAPSSLLLGSAPQTLTINGSGFVTTSTATFNQISHQATYISSGQLTTSLSSADLEAAGAFPVVVTNPSPGGGPSNTASFTVNNPVPSILGLSPSSLVAGSPGQSLAINGSGFVSTSSVKFNGTAYSTTFVSSNQLSISLSAVDLELAGTYPVVVTNPTPGGGSSGSANLSVTNGQTANEWTWMGGGNLVNASSVYGTQGVPSVTNIPAARAFSVGWVDSSSNFWLYGGGSPNLYYGDLWMLNPAAKTWTWVSGSNTINSQAVYGTKGVPATTNAPGSRGSGSLSWIDHNGNLWLFGGIVGWNSSYYNDLWKFIPASGNWVWVSGSNNRDQAGVYGVRGFPNGANVPGARCCSVTWTDVSGNLWLFGGQGFDSKGVQGNLNDLWEFSTGTWTWVSGHNTTPSLNGEKGVYGTQGVPSVTNFPAGRDFAVSWIDNSGNLWLFGGRGVDSTGTYGLLNDLWEFTPGANTWTWVSGSQLANSVGVSGTKGIPSTNNSPGGRYGAVSWLDGSGNFWLFGGEDDALWNFNPTAKTWTWVSGINLQRVHSVYGTMGVPSPTNDPGARFMPVAWPDTDGSLWLFGGVGFDSTGVTGYLNDLWRYQP
jgi:hypothetical protein